MQLFAAVDLMGGWSVRLTQGKYEQATTYGDPIERARALASAGAHWLHVVDLDAARTGEPVNRPVVAAIIDAVDAPVQVGGGARDEASVEALLELGAARVVLGTAAVADPTMVRRIGSRAPGRIAVAVDHRGGEATVSGWKEGTGRLAGDIISSLDPSSVAAVVVTDIGRDGTLTGPDVEGLRAVVASTEVPVVASGGVSSLEDLSRLARVEASERRLDGVVVGKALSEGLFTVEEALAACAR